MFWGIKLNFTGRACGSPHLEEKSTEVNVDKKCVCSLVSLQGWGLHRWRWDREQGSPPAAGAGPGQKLLSWVLCCSCPAPPVPNKVTPHSSVNAGFSVKNNFVLAWWSFFWNNVDLACCCLKLSIYWWSFLMFLVNREVAPLCSLLLFFEFW